VSFNGVQEIGNDSVAGIYQEGVIPHLNHMLLGDGLDVEKSMTMPSSDEPDVLMMLPDRLILDGVTMAVQMTALALWCGMRWPGIEFESARDQHIGGPRWWSIPGRL